MVVVGVEVKCMVVVVGVVGVEVKCMVGVVGVEVKL